MRTGGHRRPKLDLNDPEVKERKCLCCDLPFISSWAGNRICDVCKGTWEFKSFKDLPEEHYFPEKDK